MYVYLKARFIITQINFDTTLYEKYMDFNLFRENVSREFGVQPKTFSIV